MTAETTGTPERWLMAARLSRMTRRDRERGDDLITGIATQDQRSAEWALAEGHVIAHVTRDRNVSGAVAPWDRPELGPWLTDPGKVAQYDGIVAWDVSRVSRDYADLPQLRKWAERHGKKLYVIKDRLRWPDNRDGMLWAVAGERAYQERQDMIERTTRELDALRAAGKLTGRPPFGYVSAGEKYDHTLVPTDAGREYVPQIFARVIAGESLAAIARWLDSEGVRPASGASWWARSLGALVRNPVYTGRRQDASGRTILRCEPLVDAVTFRRAGEALDGRPKRGPANAQNRAMLAEVLTCPRCAGHSPMYRITTRSGVFYRCAGRGSQRKGCGNMVPLAALDELVSRFLLNFDAEIMTERLIPGHDHAAELEDVRMEMRDLAARDLTDGQYDAELARLRAERDRLAALPSVPDHVEWIAAGRTHAQEWESLGEAERGAWLRGKGVRVYPARDREACEAVFPGPMAQFMAGAHVIDYGTGVSAVITIAGSGLYAAAELED
jgi:site-specific DNA recombinase